jgi:hypothetical protein
LEPAPESVARDGERRKDRHIGQDHHGAWALEAQNRVSTFAQVAPLCRESIDRIAQPPDKSIRTEHATQRAR